MGIINSFTFNGINSLTKGVYVSGKDTFNSPQRNYDRSSIPGRNGDLLIDYGTMGNVEINYDAAIFSDNPSVSYDKIVSDMKAWLLSSKGYCRLQDTYHPDYYRMGFFEGPIDFDTILLEAGSTSLVFNCMPQCFLITGETPVTISASGNQITNPTLFDAKPLIQVSCTANTAGTITINGHQINITNTNTDTIFMLDCEVEYAYSTASGNPGIGTKVYGEYPILKPGANTVSFSGCVTSLTIIPRWWTV